MTVFSVMMRGFKVQGSQGSRIQGSAFKELRWPLNSRHSLHPILSIL